MKHKNLFALLLVLLSCVILVSCSDKQPDFAKMQLNDGVYTGEYAEEDSDDPSKIEVEITIQDGKIVACNSVEYDKNGKPKADEYAAISPEAARAVAGMNEYPALLVAAQDPAQMDAVSGATVSFKRFQNAVWDALKKADKAE